ncbi:hypothetical protein [Amycolatopsis suaedae]|uniref:Integral membrane protein n=1 Tax=Amycolatopsis suaedae TaxID=2510978 RepID=A0A4Q7J5Z0_9PSEU|nr:hypothetical protein [Amycolatopsis suaedae]RZQ61713.1 hypothetical protein EWH70_22410 [Amycolatopsis suaedae]
MVDALATGLIIATLLGALWALVLVIRNRRPDTFLLIALGVIELAFVVQLVIGVVKLVGTDRPVSGASFVGYLIGCLIILPIAVAWSLAERSRWGTAVLIVACLALPVMIVRMQQIWDGHA